MLRLGPVTVDLERGEIRAADGGVAALTANEHQILSILAASPNQTVPRQRLLTEALGYRAGLSTRALSNAVLRLRQKLESDPGDPVHLKTVYGVGYRLDVPETAPTPSGPAGLVGRDADLVQLRGALHRGRVVTLLGPAGVGKTTLARHLLSEHTGGLFVELVGARTAAELEGAAAAALGISRRSGQVERSLRARGEVLVVLDNAEQAVEAVAAAAARWREHTAARMLITSRRPLGLHDEMVLSLPPLGQDDGVRLFRARAPWVDAPAERVGALVERLDGLPLAIELAAARSRLLSLPDLLARLRQAPGGPLLRSGHPGQPARQASMEAALDGSWELLTADERAVLAACARFTGPFSGPEVEALLPDTADVLSRLDGLLHHSLLAPGPAGRLHLLATVRDFILARTPPRDARHLDERLHGWAVAEGERHAAALHRGGWRTGFPALQRLEPELRAVWRVHREEDPALAVRAALVLDAAWLQHGHRDTHLAVLREARALPGVPAGLRARVDAALGLQLLEGGEVDEALDVLEGAHDGPSVPASTRLALRRFRSVALLARGQADPARALLTATLDQARNAGDPWHEGMLLTTLSRLELACGDLDAAERAALDALPLLRRTGHRFGEGNVRERLGRILTARGDLAGALAEYQREQEIWAGLEVASAEATALISQASVQLHRLDGHRRQRPTFDPAGAEPRLLAARELLQREGWTSREAFALLNLVCAGIHTDRLDRAEGWLAELEEALLLSPHPALLDWLTPLIGGVLAARAGRPAQAASRTRRGLLRCPDPDQAEVARSLIEDGPGPTAPAGALRVLWELLHP